jgi:hypothetical protein
MLIATIGDAALLAAAAAVEGDAAPVAAGVLPRVALVMPLGAAFAPTRPGAAAPAWPNADCEGPVTAAGSPQPTAANMATMIVHERTTVIFQPLGLKLRPEH